METIHSPEFLKSRTDSLLWTDSDVKRRESTLVLRIIVEKGEPQAGYIIGKFTNE